LISKFHGRVKTGGAVAVGWSAFVRPRRHGFFLARQHKPASKMTGDKMTVTGNPIKATASQRRNFGLLGAKR